MKKKRKRNVGKFVSHQTIADATGYSRSTVSRALKNSRLLPPATKQRILQAAHQLGHRPNPLVSSLMERIRTSKDISYQGKIAVVTDRKEGKAWHQANATWNRIYDGAVERARERGYALETFNLRDYDAQGRRLTQVLISRGIHCIYVAPGLSNRRLNLEWEHFSVGTTGYSLASPRLNRVCHNNFHAIQLACQRLLETGYRRPGLYIEKRQDDVTNHHYRAGFQLFQTDYIRAGDRIKPKIVSKLNAKAFLQWLKRTQPDVVLAHKPILHRWAVEAGCRCPQDHAFVLLDRSRGLKGMAGIDHEGEKLGRSVVDLILDQIQRGATGVPEDAYDLILEGSWIEGPSAAKRRKRKKARAAKAGS